MRAVHVDAKGPTKGACRQVMHGVQLGQSRVVDASVMPTNPRANTNLTCIMIGEHVADWMRGEA